jgi:CheY-like chemotaxis protein
VPTILVADDNSNIQKMVSLVFKEKGINVVAVGNGEAACRKVPEVHPDVVLADVFMPVRNGYEVCEFVKQDPQFAETPVILLVGAFDPLDEKEAQRVGANGVLKKPFVPPEPLITMVSSLLKIEPPAEEPQPASAPAESSMPQIPAESGPTARQLAIASAQAQYAGTDEDETVTTFTAPVATPTPTAKEQEAEEEYSEPASEWARRRATMDYEIDAAESADMVEKLAAQSAAEEPEIQAKNKRLPFGGANIPRTQNGDMPASSPSSSDWPEMEAEISVEPLSSVSPSPEITEEFAPPALEEQEISTRTDGGNTPKFEEAEIEPPATLMRVPSPGDLDIARESNITAAANAHKASHKPSFDALPEIHIAQPPAELEAPLDSDPFEPFSEPEKMPALVEEESPALSFAHEAPEMPSPAYSEAGAITADEEHAQPSRADIEAGTKEAASKPPVDQATVDDVVAKVISKLEPQLHQALANGVLRPLVEELLNQQREKK